MSALVLFGIVLVLVAILAPLARLRLRHEQPKPQRRWQIFVPRARFTSIARTLRVQGADELFDVDISALPYEPSDPNTAIVIDTQLVEELLLEREKMTIHFDDVDDDKLHRALLGYRYDAAVVASLQTPYSVLITGVN